MTTYMTVPVSCAVCGAETHVQLLTSTSSFGASDLDLRPPGPSRGTVGADVQACAGCGRMAFDLSDAAEAARQQRDPAWRERIEDTTYPDVARFYRAQATQEARVGNHTRAANLLLRAAWACDDEDAAAPARDCRRECVAAIDAAHAAGATLADAPATDELLTIDLLRRAGEFDAAQRRCEAAAGLELQGLMAQVLDYERDLIECRDDAVHTVAGVAQSI